MSDVSLDFPNLLLVLILAAALIVFSLIALAALAASFFKARQTAVRAARQNAFAYFLAAAGVIVLNILAAIPLLAVFEKLSRETRNILDPLIFLGWLPASFIAFVFIIKLIRRRRLG